MFDLRFNDHWKVTSQVGLQWEQSKVEQYIGPNTFSMRYMREESKDGESYIIPEGGMHKVSNSTTSQITWKIQGEWNQTFKDIHEVQIMGGSEIRKNWYDALASTAYGYDPKTLTTKPLNIDPRDADDYPLHIKSYTENAFASFYANGSYTLNETLHIRSKRTYGWLRSIRGRQEVPFLTHLLYQWIMENLQ